MSTAPRNRDDVDGINMKIVESERQALFKFITALKVGAQRSPTVTGGLLEAVSKAMDAGEVQLDSVRLNGLRVTNDDVEVIEVMIIILHEGYMYPARLL